MLPDILTAVPVALEAPERGGRGSLKGRGASQAPSLPLKANLWQTLLPGARNTLER